MFLEELAEQVGRDYDAFDLVCHVAFDPPPLTPFGTPVKIVKLFGGKDRYLAAIYELEAELYREAA